MKTNKLIAKAVKKDVELQGFLYTALKYREGIGDKHVLNCAKAIRKFANRLQTKHGIGISSYW